MAASIETDPARSFWEHLGEISDRRGRKGRQYGLPAVLTLALAAMLSGANDLRAVFRWGRRLPPEALFLLGLDRAPCHAMYHYFFKALDVSATEAVLWAWVCRAGGPGQDLGQIALDGKRLRGSSPQALTALRNAMLHVVRDAPGPLAETREVFAENRHTAIHAAQRGFLCNGPAPRAERLASRSRSGLQDPARRRTAGLEGWPSG